MSLAQMYPSLTAWLAVPYAERSATCAADTPAGWDCWGVIEYVGRTQFGQDYEAFAGAIAEAIVEAGPASDALTNERFAALVREVLPFYRAVPPGAGRIALFRAGGEMMHVGLMLTQTVCLHATRPGRDGRGGGTFTFDLSEDRWGKPHRFVGCFERAA